MANGKRLNFNHSAPDVTLLKTTGAQVKLSSLWAKRPLLLAFTRHHGCTQCKEMLEELVAGKKDIEKAGLKIAVIMQGTPRASGGVRPTVRPRPAVPGGSEPGGLPGLRSRARDHLPDVPQSEGVVRRFAIAPQGLPRRAAARRAGRHADVRHVHHQPAGARAPAVLLRSHRRPPPAGVAVGRRARHALGPAVRRPRGAPCPETAHAEKEEEASEEGRLISR